MRIKSWSYDVIACFQKLDELARLADAFYITVELKWHSAKKTI